MLVAGLQMAGAGGGDVPQLVPVHSLCQQKQFVVVEVYVYLSPVMVVGLDAVRHTAVGFQLYS